MLPSRPEPFHDEFISSYLYRLARENGRTVGSFLKSSEIEAIINGNYAYLCQLTGFNKDIFLATFYNKFNRLLLYNIGLSKDPRESWFARETIKVCPFCFREEQYYRIHWKMHFSFSCTKHKLFLVRRCPKCSARLKDMSFGNILPLGICHKCKAEITDLPIIPIDNFEKIEMQNAFDQLLHAANLNSQVVIKTVEHIADLYWYLKDLFPNEDPYS
jgi:hypothetical protein